MFLAKTFLIWWLRQCLLGEDDESERLGRARKSESAILAAGLG